MADLENMNTSLDLQDLDKRLVVLEERMKTMHAEYRTDIARLAEDMAKRDAARAERDATARWWQTAIVIAAIAKITDVTRLTLYYFIWTRGLEVNS